MSTSSLSTISDVIDIGDLANMNSIDESSLLNAINQLLAFTNVYAGKYFKSMEEARRVASSLFVAVYEKIFNEFLPNVVRNPMAFSDYAFNAQLIINVLCHRLNIDLHHITGWSIVNGDFQAILNLVNIFLCIITLNSLKLNNVSTARNDTKNHSSHLIADYMKRNQEFLDIHQKSVSAENKRIKALQLRKESTRISNNQKFQKSIDYSLSMHFKEFSCRLKSEKLKMLSQEYIISKQIYDELFKRFKSIEILKRKISSSKEAKKHDDMINLLQSMQNQFENLIRLQLESNNLNIVEEDTRSKGVIRLNSFIKHSIQEKCKNVINSLLDMNLSSMNRQNFEKMEMYQKLLELI